MPQATHGIGTKNIQVIGFPLILEGQILHRKSAISSYSVTHMGKMLEKFLLLFPKYLPV